jgi:hypothetical protein
MIDLVAIDEVERTITGINVDSTIEEGHRVVERQRTLVQINRL